MRHHLVKVHFDRRAANINQEWLDRRYFFFSGHTLRSLKAQTHQDFKLWFCCGDEGMRDMVKTLKLVAPPDSLFTFGKQHLSSVPEFQALGWQPDPNDQVYITRIDSDDLYAPDALECIHRAKVKNPAMPEALLFRRGYMHDTNTGETGVYSNPSSPFHTVVWPAPLFLSEESYWRTYVGDHSKVRGAYSYQYLPDWKFTVLIHSSNFLSTMAYSRSKEERVEKGWSIERFLSRPIVFDVDDYCDKWDCTRAIDHLKQMYPNFKCTLFTVPGLCSKQFLAEAAKRKWVEMAVHGFHHYDHEMPQLSKRELQVSLNAVDWNVYAKGFRPPFWELTDNLLEEAAKRNIWVAGHVRDRARLEESCPQGYYVCDERNPYWHGHTHDVCGNWIDAHLEELLKKWPKDQAFSFVSEAVLLPQGK